MPELLIILALALIVFGPDKLPEVASTVGKAVREVRSALDLATHPEDHEIPEDFSTYYYESLERAGDEVPEEEGGPSHYPLEGPEDLGEPHSEPIPFRSDPPDLYPDHADYEEPLLEPEPDEEIVSTPDVQAEPTADTPKHENPAQ
jgi:TatA/E family protein of Tat protein translocase